MRKKERLSLQPSEAQVFRAAAQIYSAYVACGVVQQGTETQWLDKCASEALYLALRVDERIQSDDEIEGGLGGGLGGLGGSKSGGIGLRRPPGSQGPLGLRGE